LGKLWTCMTLQIESHLCPWGIVMKECSLYFVVRRSLQTIWCSYFFTYVYVGFAFGVLFPELWLITIPLWWFQMARIRPERYCSRIGWDHKLSTSSATDVRHSEFFGGSNRPSWLRQQVTAYVVQFMDQYSYPSQIASYQCDPLIFSLPFFLFLNTKKRNRRIF